MSRDANIAPIADQAPGRLGAWIDPWASGARGPLLAAALVLLSALPGLFALPPLDRDESRFAQATAQMLETGDFINIRYQAEPRDKKPVGIYWLQAASVRWLSSVEQRRIWAYRIPSLLGAMLAAAACAWGARAFFGARAGLFAGAILGASLILSSEAFVAKTDAVLCGAVTLSMAALARIYVAGRGGTQSTRLVRSLFWLGQGAAVLDKGPIGPMVAILAVLALVIADRDARWLKTLSWRWGLILVVLMVGPWAAAITASTDGRFWTGMADADIAPKLAGAHETHGAPPGLHALLAPLLMFPSALVLPAALVAGWRGRRAPAIRFALAWLVPSWVVFELLPTKLAHYTLPTYGALAWLASAALADPCWKAFGARARWTGAALSILAATVLAAASAFAATRYGDGAALPWTVISILLLLASGGVGAAALLGGRIESGLALCLGLGVLAHMSLSGGLVPRLEALWPSQRVAARLAADHLDPRNGVTTGPVAVVGYAEPSLVFALGTGTELDNAADGADSVGDGQPAIVEKKQDAAFRAALKAQNVAAQPVDAVKGFDYSLGKPVDLTIWRSLAPQPAQDLPQGAATP